MPEAPIALDHAKGRTWLKWHRGRKRAADMEFDPDRIVEGMRCGASVEIDIVRHAGGGFAVLHDETLDRATTGTGLVADATHACLRGHTRRDNDGRATDTRIALLSDLCASLSETVIGTGALLQLDLKETSATLTAADCLAFARAVRPVQRHVILSGGDAMAVAQLANALPDMQIGHDPCHFGTMDRLKASGDDAEFVARAMEEAGRAGLIYLDIGLILDALGREFDMIAAFHARGRRIDAYTIRAVTPETVRLCQQLVELGVDQITTDDPEGLYSALR
ncbi:glycerophosphodiester phosphodiesterase [Oceanibium sediminis]|uniref:glycerophosphodiester phosphodiesterase n=1 Tax=Oceanibium sediminis TaxID=2026339 RepID=UPI000DD301B1|nr:glycerophosphodiester phosphodiesterase family protein [Oceanibium sediminis]